MSKKRGLSIEEKKERMLQLFYEKKDFFQLKELEKLAPKEKGIIAQSVKEVVQTLVDDGLVDSEKIGTSIYFWAFPSKAMHAKKRKLEELESKAKLIQNNIKICQDNINEAKIGREECSQREEILAIHKKLKTENEDLCTQLQVYKDNDPEVYDKMKLDIEKYRDEANKHTDNIFTFVSWCKSRFNCEEEMLYKQFGIPTEIDYID